MALSGFSFLLFFASVFSASDTRADPLAALNREILDLAQNLAVPAIENCLADCGSRSLSPLEFAILSEIQANLKQEINAKLFAIIDPAKEKNEFKVGDCPVVRAAITGSQVGSKTKFNANVLVQMSPEEKVRLLVHEWGHHLEEQRPDLKGKHEFLDQLGLKVSESLAENSGKAHESGVTIVTTRFSNREGGKVQRFWLVDSQGYRSLSVGLADFDFSIEKNFSFIKKVSSKNFPDQVSLFFLATVSESPKPMPANKPMGSSNPWELLLTFTARVDAAGKASIMPSFRVQSAGRSQGEFDREVTLELGPLIGNITSSVAENVFIVTGEVPNGFTSSDFAAAYLARVGDEENLQLFDEVVLDGSRFTAMKQFDSSHPSGSYFLWGIQMTSQRGTAWVRPEFPNSASFDNPSYNALANQVRETTLNFEVTISGIDGGKVRPTTRRVVIRSLNANAGFSSEKYRANSAVASFWQDPPWKKQEYISVSDFHFEAAEGYSRFFLKVNEEGQGPGFLPSSFSLPAMTRNRNFPLIP